MRSLADRRDVAAAVCLFVLGVGLIVLVPELHRPWGASDTGQWVNVVALAVACLGTTQRRTRPLLGLALATAGMIIGPVMAQAGGVGIFLVFGDTLWYAVRYGSARASLALTVAAGALMGLLVVLGLVLDGPDAAVQNLLTTYLVLAIPVLWAREVRKRDELVEAERRRAEQTRRLAELDRAAAVTAERTRMARDLHDVIAGQLTGIAIQSEAALSLPNTDEATLRRVLTTVRQDSVKALAEMRTMIGLLRSEGPADPVAAPPGLDRLRELVETARDRGLRVELADHRPPDAELPASIDLAAYRIVQEALTNAAKHAPGSTVRLRLGEQDGHLIVEVDNDLVTDGASRPAAVDGGSGGVGLLGLAERATAVGGHVEAGPNGDTWTVRARLPVGAR